MKILLMILVFMELSGKHFYKEKYYQELFCNKKNGKMEVVLKDLTRVDCLTKEYAIEVDFMEKWAESIGQSIYYGLMTNRKSGVLLIVEDRRKSERYIKRIMKVAREHNITVWIIGE